MEAAAVLEQNAPPAIRSTLAFSLRATGVLALAGLLFFSRLGERALWSEEVRWAQIPREMIANNDYLWPTINGHTYYDKPLGSYWLVLAASLFTGGVNEVSARLPSAIAGISAVLFAMLIARRLFDDAAALLTGVILATSFSFVFFARTASADMENVTGILAVLWLFLKYEGRQPGWWTLLLWILMALTSLTKGLLGFALPILIIGVHSTFAGPLPRRVGTVIERNRWLFNRVTLLAMPLSVLVYLAPFLAYGGASDGLEMVYRENLRRFFDPVNHRGPVYLYVGVILALFAPWSLLLPAALWPSKDGRERAFALAYFWATFVFFTLSASRRSYYLLPILPAASILVARLLTRREPLPRAAYALLLTGFFLTAAIVLLSGVVLAPLQTLLPEPLDQLPALPCPAAFLTLWLSCIGAVVFALCNLQPRRIGNCSCVIAAAAMFFLYVVALPAVEPFRTQKPFADAVRAETNGAADIALFRTREIVFYLNPSGPLPEFATPDELRAGIASGHVPWVILRRRDWQHLTIDATVRIEEEMQPWENAAQADTKLLLVEVR
jgi:4-amino-4-deoxy-L-arabinose transferase-like glycosyltransferase